MFEGLIVDYSRADQCVNEEWSYICYKCGKCGRVFDHGILVDDGGTTVTEEDDI